MIVILYDRSRIECGKIEFSMDGKKLIIDECDVIKLEDVYCITSN